MNQEIAESRQVDQAQALGGSGSNDLFVSDYYIDFVVFGAILVTPSGFCNYLCDREWSPS